MDDKVLNDRAALTFLRVAGTRTPQPEVIAEIPEEKLLFETPHCGPQTVAIIREWMAAHGTGFKHPYDPKTQVKAKVRQAIELLESLGYKLTPPE